VSGNGTGFVWYFAISGRLRVAGKDEAASLRADTWMQITTILGVVYGAAAMVAGVGSSRTWVEAVRH